MEEQILNEHKMARKVVGMLVSKSLMDLVRAALDKLGEADKSAEDILFTAEGAKAKKEIMDAVAKLLGCEQPVVECTEGVCPECHKDPCECEDKEDLQEGLVDEALHGNFELETFFKMARDIGIDKLSDLEKFLKNEAEPGETEWETMLRYRASLGNDFKIDPKANEAVEEDDKCVICGKEIRGYGNNPAPVKSSGRCCDDCNKKVVIPARLEAAKNEEFKRSDGAVEAKEEPTVLPELDESYDCEEKPSKFNRDDFKFDDDFYGECVHKDCDEDEDEVEMIFDDDPTISY